MIEALAALGAALVPLIRDALAKGASKEEVVAQIEASMIAASDAEMHRELDP